MAAAHLAGRKIAICGLDIDVAGFDEAIGRIAEASAAWHADRSLLPKTVFFANVDVLVKANRDPVLARELSSSDFLFADGVPLLWMARGLGERLPERIAGSDVVPHLAAAAAARDLSLFLLGSAPGVADRAAHNLRASNPGLRIAGTYAPPPGFESDAAERNRILDAIARASADITCVGLGAPKQERWILSERHRARTGVLIAVGGTFDLLANPHTRAPAFLQRLGLEWAWRLTREPARLARRYLLEDPAILPIYLKSLRRRHRRESG